MTDPDWICEWLAERGDGPWIKEQP